MPCISSVPRPLQLSGSHVRARVQALGAASDVFPGAFTRNWIESGADTTLTQFTCKTFSFSLHEQTHNL